MEARQRPLTRSKIPARVRTASVPRPVETQKSVEFSPCTEVEQQKRVRRKWKSFNYGQNGQNQTPQGTINNNFVDILSEWREELADEHNIHGLLKLSKDLLTTLPESGPEEVSYR